VWADNETDIDLLGFDFLADELIALLCEPRLLPITVGVSGDWGSGKSSLLKMTAKMLRADETSRSVVVEFSPWKFEGFEDVKSALMQAVMSALDPAVEADKTLGERSKELLAKLVWFTVAGAVARAGLAAQTGVPIDPTLFVGLGYLKAKDEAEASTAAKPRRAAHRSLTERGPTPRRAGG
jgi:predicted KAP-like P-loop ATPase